MNGGSRVRFQNVDERSIIVTGAARGIGAEVARKFHDAGATVLCVDLDPAVRETADRLGSRSSSVVFDVTVSDEWSEAIRGRRVDVLVNCAGILGSNVPVAELEVDEWERVLRVNLTGVFVSCRAVLPSMMRAGTGRIISMASIAGKEGNPLQSAYSASKAGVIAFTKSLAREVATLGITVNCVAPTVIEGSFSNAMSEDQRFEILRKIPMGRFGQSQEVAALISWIASPECSFTTGFCFDLSGGRATT